MKKLLTILALVVFTTMSSYASHNKYYNESPADSSLCESPITITVVSVSNGTLELLVEANRVVDDVCNYFNGSWVDTGLKIWCTFNGASAECIAYRIVKAVCGINGAVRLYIEGNYNDATKKLLTTGADIWKMVMVGNAVEQGVKLVKSGMCYAN